MYILIHTCVYIAHAVHAMRDWFCDVYTCIIWFASPERASYFLKILILLRLYNENKNYLYLTIRSLQEKPLLWLLKNFKILLNVYVIYVDKILWKKDHDFNEKNASSLKVKHLSLLFVYYQKFFAF